MGSPVLKRKPTALQPDLDNPRYLGCCSTPLKILGRDIKNKVIDTLRRKRAEILNSATDL